MNCRENQKYYYAYQTGSSQVPAPVADHLERCETCQGQIQRLRDQLKPYIGSEDKTLLREHLKLHARLEGQWISCQQVRPFLPALLLEGMGISTVTPVTAHVDECALCRKHLRQIRSLNLNSRQLLAACQYLAEAKDSCDGSERDSGLVRQIKEAPASGILTRMEAADSTDAEAGDPSIQVRFDEAHAVHRRWRSLNYILTGGIAAAALFMVITFLPGSVSGNLERVDRAVRSISNVHLQRYSSADELIQEIWMSWSLGFKLYKQPQNTFFKDVRTGRIMQRQEETGDLILSSGPREEDKYTRLLPFDQLKDLPAQYQWTFKGDEVLEDGRSVQVYELEWTSASPILIVAKRWRGYLDPSTHLPYRIEWFEKIADEYELVTKLVVSYPSETVCLEEFKRQGFQRYLNEDQLK
ncbi:MAG: hypothetical protein LLF76_12070 [Planctomycetaceae bacterium]|nr:hypothetical protein [Planctomycetaceae bacterium]